MHVCRYGDLFRDLFAEWNELGIVVQPTLWVNRDLVFSDGAYFEIVFASSRSVFMISMCVCYIIPHIM